MNWITYLLKAYVVQQPRCDINANPKDAPVYVGDDICIVADHPT